MYWRGAVCEQKEMEFRADPREVMYKRKSHVSIWEKIIDILKL